jgi:hypothetical protein
MPKDPRLKKKAGETAKTLNPTPPPARKVFAASNFLNPLIILVGIGIWP